MANIQGSDPQVNDEQPYDSTDEKRAQNVLDQLGTYLGLVFRVVCTRRGKEGHKVFFAQSTTSMQTVTIDAMGTMTITNVHQPHLRPADVMLDKNGLTRWAMRELAGVFLRQLTPANTPKHLHEELFDTSSLLLQDGSAV